MDERALRLLYKHARSFKILELHERRFGGRILPLTEHVRTDYPGALPWNDSLREKELARMPKQEEPKEAVSEHGTENAITYISAGGNLYFAEPLATVVSGMFRERSRQADKGFNAAHDAQHSFEEWAQMFGQHYREALRLAKTGNEELFFREVEQGAALHMAALEAMVSNRAGEHTTKATANQSPRQPRG